MHSARRWEHALLSRRRLAAINGARKDNGMTLMAAELAVGQSGQVIRVVGANEVCRRLLEMGVTPGVEIRRLGTAPLGDPLEFELRGYRLSLRKSEAQQIEINNVAGLCEAGVEARPGS
ncbi:MAG: ferrous iron transport protein A [Candidatus Udaeobacter sp.]